METSSLEFRVSYQKPVITLIVAVLPLSLFCIFSVTQQTNRMQELVGRQSQTIAEAVVAEINQFVRNHVAEAMIMASDAAVVEAVQAANRAAESEAAFRAKVDRVEAIWNKPEGVPLINQLLTAPASRSLRRKLAADQQFRRITATDERGATIAATHKTLDYYQADESYWQNIYAQGRGAISLTEPLYDEASKSNYIGIGVPIVSDDYKLIGTFDALVDVSAFGPIITRPKLGTRSRVLLTKSDGTIINSTEGGDLGMGVKAPEYAAVTDSVGRTETRRSGYLVATLPRVGGTLIGYSDVGLETDFPSLNWMVLLTQPTSEAFAPMRGTARLIIALGFLALASVTFVVVYFSLHRRVETIEFHPAAILESPVAPTTEREGRAIL